MSFWIFGISGSPILSSKYMRMLVGSSIPRPCISFAATTTKTANIQYTTGGCEVSLLTKYLLHAYHIVTKYLTINFHTYT
jgi:hypothetical protein